ncbi:Methyltransferase type 11 [Minicystis rosea]|nr:Methyltransferase type 11 [Minicystis rosea]
MSDRDDLAARLSKLSPEKRRLFELLGKKGAAPKAEAIISRDRFDFEGEAGAEQHELRAFYDTVSGQLDASPFAEHALFLNYGYVPNDNPSRARVALPENCLNKNATRLVLELFGDCPFEPGRAVLDVGCGRGGLSTVLRRYVDAGPYLGIDLSPAAIAFCQRTHQDPDTRFMVGDAQHLPAADGAFSVVVNLESSHGYPDVHAFFREVARVLEPGGHFLYTDLVPTERIDAHLAALRDAGLHVEHARDVTSNVLLSCDETAKTHARAFRQENDRGIMDVFLGVPSSRLYDDMKTGRQKYLMYSFVRSR